jgi:hypothetical protein
MRGDYSEANIIQRLLIRMWLMLKERKILLQRSLLPVLVQSQSIGEAEGYSGWHIHVIRLSWGVFRICSAVGLKESAA